MISESTPSEVRTDRPTQARISRDALRNNLRVIRSHIGNGVRVMAVVKANCYGHHTGHCVPVFEAEGVDLFGVASVEEGAELRRHGVRARIAVLATPVEGQYGQFAEHDLEAFVSDIRTLENLGQAAAGRGRRLRVHAYLDTGMARNGSAPEDVVEMLRASAGRDELLVQGFASHLATSDEPGDPFAAHQMGVFETTLRRVRDEGYDIAEIHLANSGGVFNYPGAHHTLVRPGLALYGYHPSPVLQQTCGLQPVMSLHTIVTSLRRLPSGTSVSYGRRYYTKQETVIATLAIGYGDGFMRVLTNRANALIHGRRYPVAGTVCMDEVMVDLGGAETGIRVGDPVQLLGRSGTEGIDAWELALKAGTIPYEITCAVSARVPRIPAD